MYWFFKNSVYVCVCIIDTKSATPWIKDEENTEAFIWQEAVLLPIDSDVYISFPNQTYSSTD